uniref:Uncharacterized protein n=1 Tax=Arundo donax TaxID=35708 RepID=A0A0A8Y439_ARUDO
MNIYNDIGITYFPKTGIYRYSQCIHILKFKKMRPSL